jgi:hypothetical protein
LFLASPLGIPYRRVLGKPTIPAKTCWHPGLIAGAFGLVISLMTSTIVLSFQATIIYSERPGLFGFYMLLPVLLLLAKYMNKAAQH